MHRRLAAAVAFGVTYVALGRLSLEVATVHVSSSPVWPPAGLAIGFLVLMGLRWWPLVLAASWLVNFPTGAATAAWIGAGNAGEAALAAWWIRRAGGRDVLEHLRGVGVIFGAAGAGAIVSASVGAAALAGAGVPGSDLPNIWRTWALGNLAGSLLVIPWLLATRRLDAPSLLMPLAGAAAGLAAFWSPGWSVLVLIPVLAWATQQSSRTGIAGLLLGTAAGSVMATLLGRGPFVVGDSNEALLLLQLFLICASVTALILAAGNRQRRSVRRLAHPMVSLAPLIVAATFVGLIVHPTIVSLDQQDQQARADDLAEAWADATLRYGDRLLALRALYSASEEVEREEFDRFVASQNWQFGPGGSTAIGFARDVPLSELAAYEAATRNDTSIPLAVRANFTVFPAPADDPTVVDHVYPLVPEPGAIGLDLRGDPDGRWALDEAHALGAIIATPPKDIISPTGAKPGFFLSLPVHEQGTHGYIVLAQTVEDMAVALPRDAPYRVTDLTAESIVLHEHAWNGTATHTEQFEAWGRVWLLEMQIKSTLPALDAHAPWFVLGSGAMLSIAIAGTVYAHDSTKARAKTMSRDLIAQARTETEQRMEIERLRDRDKVRRDFLNMVAHELRTPLMPIRTQTYLLRRAGGESRNLDILDRSVDRLNAVVDDLLDASRLEAKGMELNRQPADVLDICQRAVEAVQEQARGAKTKVSLVGARAVAHVDDARIAQIIDNLLSNALKFAPAGQIEVRVQDGDDVVIEVRDNGQGIDPGKLDEVGQPFAQVHEPRAGLKGTGLGLYICTSIAKLHGGSLTLTSPGLGHGCTATLRLPKEEEREEAPAEAEGFDAEE